jgi:hypothetical protein
MYIIVVPLLSSNICCPITTLELLPLLSSTLAALAMAAASLPLPMLLPSPLPFLPLPSLPSSLALLCQCHFVIVVLLLCFFAANWKSWTNPCHRDIAHGIWMAPLSLDWSRQGLPALTQGHYVLDGVFPKISWCLSNGCWS